MKNRCFERDGQPHEPLDTTEIYINEFFVFQLSDATGKVRYEAQVCRHCSLVFTVEKK